MRTALWFLLVLSHLAVSRTSASTCPSLAPQCTCTPCSFNAPDCLTCQNISTFDQINFSKLNASAKFSYVTIGPANGTAFVDDDSLDLSGLVMTEKLSLSGISGLSITAEPFRGIRVPNQSSDAIAVELSLADLSNLTFKKQRFDSSACKMSLLSDPAFKPGLFRNVKSLTFGYRVLFDEPLCTLLFKDNELAELEIADLVEGYRNVTRFIDPLDDALGPPDLDRVVNSSIRTLKLTTCTLQQLGPSIVNPHLFKGVQSIDYTGDLGRVHRALLAPFSQLRSLSFSLNNLASFVRSGLSWMNELNKDVRVDLGNRTQIDALKERHFVLGLGDMRQEYDFPDEDLCYFKYFAHERLMFPLLNGKTFPTCTCTIYWLLRDWQLFREPNQLQTLLAATCIQKRNFTQMVADCRLDERMYRCGREYIETRCSQDKSRLECANFSSLDELTFSGYDAEVFDYLRLRPLAPVVFSEPFTFKFMQFDEMFTLEFNGFSGFDLAAKSFEPIRDRLNETTFVLENSDFTFYFNETNLYDAEACIKLVIDRDFESYLTNRVVLLGSMRYDRSEKVCPYVLKNAHLYDLEVHNLSDLNRLRFFDFSNRQVAPARKLYDFSLKTLSVKASQLFNLDSSLLNTEIFHRIESLTFTHGSQLYHVDADLLDQRSFPQLKYIGLELARLDEFVRSSTNDWLRALNSNVQASAVNGSDIVAEKMLLRLSDEPRAYEFGEQDFCHFQHMPQDRLVLAILETRANLACTCTVLWLIQGLQWIDKVEPASDRAGLFDLVLTSSVRSCYESENLTQEIEACGFEAKLEECKAFTGSKRTTTTTAKQPEGSTVKSGLEDDLERERTTSRNLAIAVGALAVFSVLVLVGLAFLTKRYRSLKSSFMRNEALSFSPLS